VGAAFFGSYYELDVVINDVRVKAKAGIGNFPIGKKVYVALDRRSVAWVRGIADSG
jgi:hypothetical protein